MKLFSRIDEINFSSFFAFLNSPDTLEFHPGLLENSRLNDPRNYHEEVREDMMNYFKRIFPDVCHKEKKGIHTFEGKSIDEFLHSDSVGKNLGEYLSSREIRV